MGDFHYRLIQHNISSSQPQNKKESTWLYSPIRINLDTAPILSQITDLPGVPNVRKDGAINALVDRVFPQVVDTLQSLLWVEPPSDPVNLRNRYDNCGSVPLPETPMINSDFHLIIDGAEDSVSGTNEERACNSFENLAAISDTCAFDLYPLNPRAGE